MNSRGILKFDWPKATLLSGGGLHYGQESFSGGHCTWMKKWHGNQRGGHFLEGEFSGGQVAVRQTWTKRNDYAPKNECVGFLNICHKNISLEKRTKEKGKERMKKKNKKGQVLTTILSSLVFNFFSPKQIHSNVIITTFLCHGPLPFFARAPILLLPPQNPLDHDCG